MDGSHNISMVLVAHCLTRIVIQIASQWIAAFLANAPLVALEQTNQTCIKLSDCLVEYAKLGHGALYLVYLAVPSTELKLIAVLSSVFLKQLN